MSEILKFMVWIIYFLIIFLADIAEWVQTLSGDFTTFSVIRLLLTSLMTFGLFCYVFNKYLFNKTIWKIVFWGNLIYAFFGFILATLLPIASKKSSASLSFSSSTIFVLAFILLLIVVFVVPTYLALYSLSKGMTRKQNPIFVVKKKSSKKK